MAQRISIPWISLGSFGLAILLSMLGGPTPRAAGRSAGGATACKHTFTKKIPSEQCLDSETNHVADNPAACVDAPPLGGTKWYSKIEGPGEQGVYVVSAVASGAANDGTNLGPADEAFVDANKTLSGTMPCTPCHTTTSSVYGVATATTRMGHPKLPFDFTYGSCIATVNVTRSHDCGGPSDAKSSIAYTMVFRTITPGLRPGEREIGFYISGPPGALQIEDAEPVQNNPDQYACRGQASLANSQGSIAQNASVTFQGHGQILIVRAPFTKGNPQDGTTGAMAAGRLGDLTLVDTDDSIGD
jgi:hypothetical protein